MLLLLSQEFRQWFTLLLGQESSGFAVSRSRITSLVVVVVKLRIFSVVVAAAAKK